MNWKCLAVGPIAANCYILHDETSNTVAIIDPGGDREKIIAAVASMASPAPIVKLILLTHGHFDHVFAAGDLAKHYGATIAMNVQDIEMINDGLSIADLYYDMSTFVDFRPDRLLEDGDVLELGSTKIEAWHTPGHSKGCMCYATDAGVFCGDLIFENSVGRTDFPGGSYDELINSIRTKILTLKDDTPLYSGHGSQTTVGRERENNPFIR